MGDHRAGPRPATFIPSGLSLRGWVPTPLATVAVRRAAVRDQGDQPDRAEIGRSDRLPGPLPSAAGGADGGGACRGLSMTYRARSFRRRSCLALSVRGRHRHDRSGGAGSTPPRRGNRRRLAVLIVVVVLAVPSVRAEGRAPHPERAVQSLEPRAVRRAPQAHGAVRRDRRVGVALCACSRGDCLAYGVDLNLVRLVFINTSASVLSSVIPVPGGIGAAEGRPLGRAHRDQVTSRRPLQ